MNAFPATTFFGACSSCRHARRAAPRASQMEQPALAQNLMVIRNVCLKAAPADVERVIVRQAGRTTLATRAVAAQVWEDEKSSLAAEQLCTSLTSCHLNNIAQQCARRRHTGISSTASLLRANTGLHVEMAAEGTRFPLPGARRARRAALLRVTGNIGHDLYQEGILDFYAQVALEDSSPNASDRLPFYDAFVLEAYWFAGAEAFKSALAKPPNATWTLAMIDAVFNSTGRVPMVAFSNPYMRWAQEPINTLGADSLCVDELYFRLHHATVGVSGGVSWHNVWAASSLRR